MADATMCLVWVFDGLRPEFVQPDWMPRLCRFVEGGVRFTRSHCVFPSVTRVNAATLVTGVLPGAHGIEGNTVWRPAVEPTRTLKTATDADLRRLRAESGRLLRVPTLGEILADEGMTAVASGTGSPGCGFLLHPEADAVEGRVYHPTFTTPADLSAEVVMLLGPEPSHPEPLLQVRERVEYGARVLTDVLIPSARPALATFWSTIPDGIHHRYGLGSPEAVAGIGAADASFGRALDRLAAAGLLDHTDIFVTADHGYSTVSRHIDVAGALVAAGLKRSPDSTDVVVCPDGGACLVYAETAADVEGLARFFLSADWISAVFSRDGVPGTLPLAAVGCHGPNAPDLIACFAWDDTPNAHGVPGVCAGGGGIAVGAGDHGGISPFEMRNILFAAGPHLRTGAVSDVPCGIADIAPTILHCLGVAAPAPMDGRLLVEALRDGDAPPAATTDRFVADHGGLRQTATVERVGAATYTRGAGSVRA